MTISAYFLTTLAEFGEEQIGETLADSANNAFVNAHFFSRTTVETQNEVATQESSPALIEDVGESPSATMPSIVVKYNALIMNLQNVALQCRLKAEQWLACRSLNTKTQFVRALTIGSLTSELQTGNVIARSDLRQFILLTDTFTSSFTAKLAENTVKLFELMKQNPTRTIADFGTDQAILRELGLTGCYLYFEVRDASGAWVRASSSMTLADLVLHYSEIRVGDPALRNEKISDYKNWLKAEFDIKIDPTIPNRAQIIHNKQVQLVQDLFDGDDLSIRVPVSRDSNLLELDYLYYDLYKLTPLYSDGEQTNRWISKEGLIFKIDPNTGESRVDHILKHLKQIDEDENQNVLYKQFHTHFLLGNPDLIETQQKLLQVLEIIFKYIKQDPNLSLGYLTLHILPGTRLMNQLVSANLFNPSELGITTVYFNYIPLSYNIANTDLFFKIRTYNGNTAEIITFFAE